MRDIEQSVRYPRIPSPGGTHARRRTDPGGVRVGGRHNVRAITASGPGSAIYVSRLPTASFAIRHHHLGFLIHDEAQWDALESNAARSEDGAPEKQQPGFLQNCFVDAPELGHYLEYIFPEQAGIDFFESVPGNRSGDPDDERIEFRRPRRPRHRRRHRHWCCDGTALCAAGCGCGHRRPYRADARANRSGHSRGNRKAMSGGPERREGREAGAASRHQKTVDSFGRIDILINNAGGDRPAAACQDLEQELGRQLRPERDRGLLLHARGRGAFHCAAIRRHRPDRIDGRHSRRQGRRTLFICQSRIADVHSRHCGRMGALRDPVQLRGSRHDRLRTRQAGVEKANIGMDTGHAPMFPCAAPASPRKWRTPSSSWRAMPRLSLHHGRDAGGGGRTESWRDRPSTDRRSSNTTDEEQSMVQVMKGFRVLEVAQFTFVPAAGAILADWGADVIKIEHPVRGDTQRGFINMGGVTARPESPSTDRTSQSRQAQRRHRHLHAGRAGVAVRNCKDRRRLPHQLSALGAPEEQDRRRAHSRRQSQDHLRARQRLRRQGSGARDRRLRRHGVLDAQRRRPLDDPAGTRGRSRRASPLSATPSAV